MKFVVNGNAYPLRGYTDPSEYTILGLLSFPYYLCKGNDGSVYALYLPNVNEYFPKV